MMSLKQLKIFAFALFISMLFLASKASAQDYKAIELRIDSFSRRGLPKSALAEADKLEKMARKNKNLPMQVKAVIYRMTFQSSVDENAERGMVNTLKNDLKNAQYPLKPVLQSLLAEMYWTYYQKYRWKFFNRSRLEKPDPDFTRWDLQTLINQTSGLYELSLKEAAEEQKTPVSILDGALSGDKKTRELRPSLYDLLVNRAFDFYLTDEPALTRPKLAFSVNDERLFGPARNFVSLTIKTADTGSTFYKGIKYLQQATAFHLKHGDDQAVADLDLRRLGFLYGHTSLQHLDSLYLAALNKVALDFASNPISARALELLGSYYRQKDSLVKATEYFKKAVARYPKSLGGENSAAYLKLITERKISALVENINMPAKPVLALLSYQNINAALIRVYKISATQFDMVTDNTVFAYGDSLREVKFQTVYTLLDKLKPVQSQFLHLPGSMDYRSHSAEFKINPTSPGFYVLIVQDTADGSRQVRQLVNFKVTSLAFASRKNQDGNTELRVMDRETGAPLAGVHVTIAETMQGTTDSKGSFIVKKNIDNPFSVKLTLPGDTLYSGNNSNYNFAPPNTNEPIIRTILFTDRTVYRPGQTVYFKGLHMQTFNGKNKILVNKSLTLTIKDQNQQDIGSIPVTTGEFGSFAGSFVIPQNILKGQISIISGFGNKFIRVEEYKRPTFLVDFLQVNGNYQHNDSVKVEGRVTAFSGYGLSQARVVYHITRQPFVKDFRNYTRYAGLFQNNTAVTVDTVITNGTGRFEIKFKASPDQGINLDEINYRYTISADVTDGSGETRTATTSLVIGNNNFVVDASVPLQALSGDSIRATARIINLNDAVQKGSLKLTIYALEQPLASFKARVWQAPDQLILDKASFIADFPDYAYHLDDQPVNWPVKNKLADTLIIAGSKPLEVFNLDAIRSQPGGYYRITISAVSERGDTSSVTRYLYFVNKTGPAKPVNLSNNWLTPLSRAVEAGQAAKFLVGNGGSGYVLMEKYVGSAIRWSQWMHLSGAGQILEVPIAAGEKNISVQFLMVYRNRLYNSYNNIRVNRIDTNLAIKFLTFRNKLQPGEKEQWKLQVSAKGNEKIAAEMVAGLYDASLDEIARPDDWTWQYDLNRNFDYTPQYFTWNNYWFINAAATSGLFSNNPYKISYPVYEGLTRINNNNGAMLYDEVLKRRPGMAVTEDAAPVMRNISIRGSNYGYEYKSDLRVNQKSFLAADISGATNQLNADTSRIQEIYGYADTFKLGKPNSILHIAPPITIRKNFSETAFFYPQLRTNEKGEILIDFTIPEALTRWRFKAFAHTQSLETGYLQSEVLTQKKLSISGNMPRFFREGDTIIVSARLANLTAEALKGSVQLQLFNAINMQPVKLLASAEDSTQNFALNGTTTMAIAFKIIVPAGLNALTYRLTARAGDYSDGEENTFPVLTNRMLVTESLPLMLRAGQTRNFTFDKLLKQTSKTLESKTLTLEYTQNPAWYAVQALPYMMEYPYECSEQTLNRYYANNLALSLVNRMPVVRRVFEQWKAASSSELLSGLEKNQELKTTLIEETPWLKDAIGESEQKKRIALLFDLNKMSYELQLNLDKLQSKQLANGGFPWFGGDHPDRYITQYILGAIGQLYRSKVTDDKNQELKNIADKAIGYLDKVMLEDDSRLKGKRAANSERVLTAMEIHGFYAQSYFARRTLTDPLKALLNAYLKRAERQWTSRSVYEQAMIALTLLRNGKAAAAAAVIKSLQQRAQQHEELGMYWANNTPGYYWYQAPVEAQCLLIELFSEAGNQDKAVEEMKIWLLANKQTNNWKTTKATASACYALLLNGQDLLNPQNTTAQISLGGKDLTALKPDLAADAGTGYLKTSWSDGQIKPSLGNLSITNNSKSINWGALHWQYLENLDKITSSKTGVALQRKYFISEQSASGPVLVALDAAHRPKTGDLLKVVIYLSADRDLQYIQLKDMRPAGTEPVDVLSAYKYQDGLSYYQLTRDVATSFFISEMKKGSYVFEYRLRVVQPGNFSTGITTEQSMYAPEFNAHSQGTRLTVMP